MALPPLTPPQFPNVPAFPGVPALTRSPFAPLAAVAPRLVPVAADALNILRQLGIIAGPQWGVYDATGKTLILNGDAVGGIDAHREFQISDYPIQNGDFRSYNKVARPQTITIRVHKGGSPSARQAFINQIEEMIASTTLFTIIQPDLVVRNMNPVSREFERSQTKGANMLSVDIRFQEIRTTATAGFSNTATPGSADATNAGQVQAGAPTAAQAGGLGGPP